MFARRGAFHLASRLPAARSPPVVPLARCYSEVAAAPSSPAASTETPSPVHAESTPEAPKTSSPTSSAPPKADQTRSYSSARSPPLRKPFVKTASKPYTSKAAPEATDSPSTSPTTSSSPNTASSSSTVTLVSGKKGLKFVHTPLVIPSTVRTLPPVEFSPPPAVQWDTSHYGISSRPVTMEQFDTLTRPLPLEDIEVKPDGVLYLPEIKYRRRLNEVFGPMGWGLIPRGEPVVGDSIVTREYALIAENRFVSQAQGENNYFGSDQLPSAVEGCKSNALMRCCKDLGIASELWDPVFIRWFKKHWMKEVWVEHVTTKKKRTLWYRIDDVNVAYPYKEVKR